MNYRKRQIHLVWAVVCFLNLAIVRSQAQSMPQPASPSPSAAASKAPDRWKQSELYRSGQKAYAEKKYAEAFKQLVMFKAANQEIFSAPPKDLEARVKEIADAISFCETQLAQKAAARPESSKHDDPSSGKPGVKDGIHHSDGYPGVTGGSVSDKGRVYGAHESGSEDKERAGAGRDKASVDRGASAREGSDKPSADPHN